MDTNIGFMFLLECVLLQQQLQIGAKQLNAQELCNHIRIDNINIIAFNNMENKT